MKMEFDYSHPDTDLRFGRGRRDEVGEVAAEYGDAVHVVTTRSAMQDAGFLDGVLTSLDAADVETTVTEGVQPNPTVEDVLRVVDDARGSDAVIGFGGGSVIDTAKTAALCLGTFDTTPSREEVWEYCIGEKGVESSIPVLVVPTTSGTGSHID
ncbi:MAG: iron-containing alcohol dehydrogenase, partial [Halobacteria archaeon]|nr:iron-containing alcohol dehydrogenase [Halobacteria archaeon]